MWLLYFLLALVGLLSLAVAMLCYLHFYHQSDSHPGSATQSAIKAYAWLLAMAGCLVAGILLLGVALGWIDSPADARLAVLLLAGAVAAGWITYQSLWLRKGVR